MKLNQISAVTGGKVYRSDVTVRLVATLLNRPPSLNYRITFQVNSLDGKYRKLRIATPRRRVSLSGPERYYSTEPPKIVIGTDKIPHN